VVSVSACDVLDGWLSAIRGIPDLPLAACRGKSDLFNGDTVDDRAEAIRICQGCPELLPCKRYSATLSDTKIHGVIAAEYREWVSHLSERKRRSA
jgi:hypothetical protein